MRQRRHDAHHGLVKLVIPNDDRGVVLDLFSCGGGAARGYLLAGFRGVICIDRDDHAASIAAIGGEFHRMDWREGLRRFGHLADFISASPPCQFDSIMSQCRPGLRDRYPDLVGEVREALVATGKPFVIEQPESGRMRTKMHKALLLCGTMFGLTVSIGASTWELRRHRLFESNVPLLAPGPCNHQLRVFPIYGHGYPGNRREEFRGLDFAEAARRVMGIDWTTDRREVTEALPPVYTGHIGGQVLALEEVA